MYLIIVEYFIGHSLGHQHEPRSVGAPRAQAGLEVIAPWILANSVGVTSKACAAHQRWATTVRNMRKTLQPPFESLAKPPPGPGP